MKSGVKFVGIWATAAMALASLAACSVTTETKSGGIVTPAATTYAQLSPAQQQHAWKVSSDVTALLALVKQTSKDVAEISAFQMNMAPQNQTIGQANPIPLEVPDSVTTAAIAKNCVYRSMTISDPTGQSSTKNYHEWFDDAPGKICPVTFEVSGSTTAGATPLVNRNLIPFGTPLETHGVADYNVSFSVHPGTDVYDQGSIRSIAFSHHEEIYALDRSAQIPTMEGKRILQHAAGGQIVLAGGDTVPMTISHSADYRILPIDDTATTNSGGEVRQVEMGLTFGHAQVRTEDNYVGKTTGSTTTTFVNGTMMKRVTH